MPTRILFLASLVATLFALGSVVNTAAQEPEPSNIVRFAPVKLEAKSPVQGNQQSDAAEQFEPYYPAGAPRSQRSERNEIRLTQAPKAPNKTRPAPPAPAEDGPRDPTTVRPDLRPVLDPGATITGLGASASTFRLRGRVGHASGKGAAILEVNGQLFMIQEGATIETVSALGELTINVKKVSGEGVTLEVEQTGKTIRLR